MKKLLLIIGGGFLVLVILGSIGKNSSDSQNSVQPEQKQETVSEASPAPKLEYEMLDRTENKLDENISVLIKPGELDPKAIAEDVHKNCKKSCNVSIYDDKKAFDLDVEYTKMLSYDYTVEQRTAWKEKNTVFLADHLVATVGYGDKAGWGFGAYKEYPLKDSYYKELKGEK